MLNQLLLPNKFKRIGWCLLVVDVFLTIFGSLKEFEISWLNAKVFAIYYNDLFDNSTHGWFCIIKTNLTMTLIGVIFIIGAMFVGFSKEKKEDEFIARLRLSSLLWAVLVNYALLLLAFLFIYGINFLNIMMYNMFTVLIIFIIRINYILYKTAKAAR